jgi:cation transport ATPase
MSQTTTFSVDGMTCAHCVHHVTTELTAIPGVRDVSIDLVNGGSSPVTCESCGGWSGTGCRRMAPALRAGVTRT